MNSSGFSIIPLTLQTTSEPFKLKDESSILNESGLNNSKLVNSEPFINAKTEEPPNLSNSSSQFMMNSYSSKIQEFILPNDDGLATFDSIYVDVIRNPIKMGDSKKSSTKKKSDLGLGSTENSCIYFIYFFFYFEIRNQIKLSTRTLIKKANLIYIFDRKAYFYVSLFCILKINRPKINS